MPRNEGQMDALEQIKRLLMLSLRHQGVEGQQIAGVLEVDPAVVSRILSGAKKAKKK